MKNLIFVLPFFLTSIQCFAQPDSISFAKSSQTEIKIANVEEITINKIKVKTNESTQYLSINDKCNFIVPKYSELTESAFLFKKIKSNAQASLSALGSSLSVEKKSEFYVYYLKRSKNFNCFEENIEKKVSYGVGAYVLFKMSDLKVKIDIKTPNDIAAAGQLGLARIDLDVRTFGMTPSLADEFLPNGLSKIDVDAAKYFDKLLEITKMKINDKNTIPNLLPIEL